MPPVQTPSSPLQEIAARRRWEGPTLPGGVLTPELAAFCQRGLSVIVASCDHAGRPVVGRGLACRIEPDGRVHLVMRDSSNPGLLAALDAGGRVAVTFSQPTTHRSIQLKAAGARIDPAGAADGPAALGQTAAFRRELLDVGFSESFTAAYCAFEPHDLVSVSFLPERAFVQTPGPSAGSVLE